MSGVLAKMKAAVGLGGGEPEPDPEPAAQTLLGQWGQQMDEATTLSWSQRVTGFVVCIGLGILLSTLVSPLYMRGTHAWEGHMHGACVGMEGTQRAQQTPPGIHDMWVYVCPHMPLFLLFFLFLVSLVFVVFCFQCGVMP